VVEPVKAALETFLLVTKARPNSEPKPFTILTTPGGKISPQVPLVLKLILSTFGWF
jgi:hypothetical protein